MFSIIGDNHILNTLDKMTIAVVIKALIDKIDNDEETSLDKLTLKYIVVLLADLKREINEDEE